MWRVEWHKKNCKNKIFHSFHAFLHWLLIVSFQKKSFRQWLRDFCFIHHRSLFSEKLHPCFMSFFQFLKIWPTLVGSCTLWKTSKRAIPLSPLVLPNNRFLLWKTISHSSKCLYTLTFVCSYLFQTIKREIYTWVSIKVSHNGTKINIKCSLKNIFFDRDLVLLKC